MIKVSTFHLLIMFAFFTAGYARPLDAQTLLEKKISVTLNDQKLSTALKKVSEAAKVKFSYTRDVENRDKKISLIVQDKELKLVLDQIFQPLNIKYEVMGNYIILTKNSVTDKVIGKALFPMTDVIAVAPPKIKGVVFDENGNPIADVSVLVKGTKKGAITNAAGEFTVDADANDVLVFSFIGYETQQVLAKNATRISLKKTANQLEQVVVVGYGTQKKADLTGSVSTISAKDIENRPVTNVSSALSGLAAGMFVRQGSGDPRGDGAGINIRGLATLSSTNVLVIVDGINNWNSMYGTSGIDGINPNDIESISVLKDAASAAIYGAQAANGVILITTKKGAKKKPTVTYSGIFSSTQPSGLPHWITNSVQYMNLINEAYTNVGSVTQFSAATIQAFTDAQQHPNDTTALGIPNYVAYPNTDWAKSLINNRLLQNHNISVSGGNENSSYLLSLGYLKNPGLIDNSGLEKYQFRINLESKIGNHITVGTQTFASYESEGLAGTSNLFNYIPQVSPMVYPEYNGKYATSSAVGDAVQSSQGLKAYTVSSLGTDILTNLSTTWYGKVDLIKGLSFEPKINYLTNIEEVNTYGNPAAAERWNFLTMQQTYAPTPASALSSSSTFYKSWAYTLESLLRYNTTIAKVHNIGALVGFNQYYTKYYYTGVSGTGLIDPSVPAIGTVTTPAKPSGSATDYSFRSLFGRVTYNYKERYLLEGNVRYDASSKFGPDHRYGTFPSVSAGWNLTRESFLEKLKDWNIQNLKLRASYGQLGNTASGNYSWQATYGTVPYSFNNVIFNGVRQGQIANSELHWETTNVTDIGLDLLAFKKLSVTVEWYRRFTKDILFTAPMDITVGTASAPVGNFAQVVNNGLELTVGWNDNVGKKFSYSITANLGYNYYNNVVQYKGKLAAGWDAAHTVYNSNIGAVSAGSTNRILEGHMINEFYMQTVYHGNGTYTNADGSVNPNGGPKTGMIRTSADYQWVQSMKAAGYTFQPNNTLGAGQLYYGDLIYADNNGDKIYGNANDAQFMHVSTTPKYIFGLNLNASWNNFSLNMVWAGAAGFKAYFNQLYYNSVFLALQGQVSEKIANNHYYYNVANPSDTKNNITATYPRLKSSDNIDNVVSDFWFYNASYARLKNLQISYTIPQKVLGSTVSKYVTRFNVFVSGENLLTISNSPLPDPEVGATATGYPTMKQYAVGVNITF